MQPPFPSVPSSSGKPLNMDIQKLVGENVLAFSPLIIGEAAQQRPSKS
jgi:hypothetical protein